MLTQILPRLQGQDLLRFIHRVSAFSLTMWDLISNDQLTSKAPLNPSHNSLPSHLRSTLPHREKRIMGALMFTCTISLRLFIIASLNACTLNGLQVQAAVCVLHGLPVGLKWTTYFCHCGQAKLHLQMLIAHSQPSMVTSCINMSACCFLSLSFPTYMVI